MTATTSNAPPAVLALALLLVSGATAARMLEISPRSFRRMELSGLLGPQPTGIGRLKRWCVLKLGRWVEGGAPSRRRWEQMAEARERTTVPREAGRLRQLQVNGQGGEL